jgi:hypothetical protein
MPGPWRITGYAPVVKPAIHAAGALLLVMPYGRSVTQYATREDVRNALREAGIACEDFRVEPPAESAGVHLLARRPSEQAAGTIVIYEDQQRPPERSSAAPVAARPAGSSYTATGSRGSPPSSSTRPIGRPHTASRIKRSCRRLLARSERTSSTAKGDQLQLRRLWKRIWTPIRGCRWREQDLRCPRLRRPNPCLLHAHGVRGAGGRIVPASSPSMKHRTVGTAVGDASYS